MVVSWPPQAASVVFPPSMTIRWPQAITITVPVFPARIVVQPGDPIKFEDGTTIKLEDGTELTWE